MRDGTPPPIPPATPAPQPRGTAEWLSDRGPTREQTRRSRILHGIEREVVHEIATRQAEALDLDALQQKEELLAELRLRKVEARAEHFEELARIRQTLIDAEISRRLRAILEDDDAAAIMMILGAVCE